MMVGLLINGYIHICIPISINLFNKSLDSSTLPDKWKSAHVMYKLVHKREHEILQPIIVPLAKNLLSNSWNPWSIILH